MLRSSHRRVLVGCLLLLPLLAWGQNAFSPGGNEYPIAGALPGEQTWPRAAVSTNGGVLVWQDNAADADGLGIRAVRLNTAFTTSSSVFRVNSMTAGDQEKPDVALLTNGGAVIVWQGGKLGFQDVYARFLNPTGTNFVGNDVLVNTYTNSFQINPAVATLSDGSVMIVWASDGQDGSYQGVYGQRFTSAGAKIGSEFQINSFSSNNQRAPAVAALPGGGFVVVWISELQRDLLKGVDVYARLYDSSANPTGLEFLVDSGTGLCADPTVTASPSGGFAVAWSERDMAWSQSSYGDRLYNVIASGYPASGWDVVARIYNVANGSASAATSPFRLNTMVFGDQYAPTLSSFGGSYLATWISLGQDAAWEGVYGQFVSSAGNLAGVEFHANTTTVGRQIHPSVCSDGVSRFLVTWSSFVMGTSYDLMARAYDLIQVEIAPVAGGVRVSWNTQPGSLYQVQVSSDYTNWSNYGGARTAAGFSDSITVNNLATAANFRVIRVQ